MKSLDICMNDTDCYPIMFGGTEWEKYINKDNKSLIKKWYLTWTGE